MSTARAHHERLFLIDELRADEQAMEYGKVEPQCRDHLGTACTKGDR